MGKTRPLLLLLLLLCGLGQIRAQTDTEFWFVAPRVTIGHGFDPSNPAFFGGRKFFLRFASMSLPAQIRIEMPANPLFTPIEINLPANSAHTEDLSNLHAQIWHDMPNNIENRGIRITSTTPITAYFEVGTFYNPDIFSLKGKNALGTEFYVPFQNTYRNGNYWPRPFSTINIVATHDNTVVRIAPTRNAYSGDQANPHLAGSTIVVTLNRGQTYAVAPNWIFPGGSFPLTGQLPQNRLAGTKVVADKPIAITVSDDSVDAYPNGSCQDLVGDQLVPVNILGREYIVMRGRLNANMNESAYILATQNNTEIYIDGTYVGMIHEGQQHRLQLANQTHHVQTTHPSLVFHVAGFGCEMGGAVLPPVDFCNGSSQISFTRSKEGVNQLGVVERFFLNIMVRRGAEDGFILNGSTTMVPASAFNPVPGTTQWLAAEFEFTNEISAGVASFIENTKDLFHLAIINGGHVSGTMYGYFSDFNQVKATSMIVESGTDFEAICYGQRVQLIAGGGITYKWSPPDFLDNPFSRTPIAFPDTTMHYTVVASGACGLIDSASVTVRVTDPLHALFSVDNSIGCSPFEINIVNESIGVEHYEWRLGDGTVLNIGFNTFTHTYINNSDTAQHLVISLIGRNDFFCVDTMVTRLTIYPEIKALAGFSASGCAPLTVNFENFSRGAQTYLWQFGEGASSVEAAPTHVFQNYTDKEITYNVVLMARSQFGCEDFDTLQVVVKPFIKAAFEFNPPEKCHPYNLEITNNSIGATHHIWNFDDGHPVQNYNAASFVYGLENFSNTPKVFNISLTVSNNYGCSDVVMRPVTVYPFVEARFVPDATEGCNPLTVNFQNLSVGARNFFWDFGNGAGTSSGIAPVFEFNNPDSAVPAIFNVSLMAISEFGCVDSSEVQITVYPRIEAGFVFDSAEVCAPYEVIFYNQAIGATSFVWNFGDGFASTSNESQVRHIYNNSGALPLNYNVSLLVQNDFNCQKLVTRQITILPQVIAQFAMEQSGCHPLEVVFSNLSEGGSNFLWDFGDGGTSTNMNPTRTFLNQSHTTQALFDVQLLAVSQFNCHDTFSLPVTVFPKPHAAFEIPQTQGCAPFEVSLIDHSIGNTANIWSFGNGPAQNAPPGNLLHTFMNTSGNLLQFKPHLLVLNDFGCQDTVSLNVMVFPMVQAKVELPLMAGCHPFSAQIQNLSLGATATIPYSWNYGDGSSSVIQDAFQTHVFNNFSHTQSAFYTTSLRAANIYGCRDSVEVTIEVFPRPKALFDAPGDPACSPFAVRFTDLSVGASNYNWSFGDGNTSNVAGPVSNIFVQPAGQGIGWFTVSLEVHNQYGCNDNFARQVAAYPAVEANFGGNLEGCHPLSVDFINHTQGGNLFTWNFGDGVFANENQPRHVFINNSQTNPMHYPVSLLAQNQYGCLSQISRTITVYPKPSSNFSLNTLQGCSPLAVEIENISTGATQFAWTFGAEGNSNGNAKFNWTFKNLTDTIATLPVTLRASNQWGCSQNFTRTVRVFPEVMADFTTANGQFAGCTPLELGFVNKTLNANRFEWDFDDNTQSVGLNPGQHFFAFNQQTTNYDVRLTASSRFGCQDVITKRVTVYPRPVADFSANPYIQTYPSTSVAFANHSLPGQWRYTWNLDDGSVRSFDQDPGIFTHAYLWTNNDYSTRIYNVNLKVENQWCSDNITRQVVIKAPRPKVEFQSVSKGCPPFEVKFNNKSLYGLSYHWDFGNGQTSDQASPVHIFRKPGMYQVKLLVFGQGGVDSTFQTITVHQPPIADFRITPQYVTIPYEPIQLINLSSFAHTWIWDFGDGNQSNEFEPLHYYQQAGSYNIKLTVGNNTVPVCYDTRITVGAAGAEEDCVLFFPNAFTPDVNGPGGGSYTPGDARNHVFFPVYTGIEDYVMEIYTRWGELIFRTENLEIGWDGYYRGRLSKMDVYVWKVWYTCAGTGRKMIKAGDVTLIR